MTEIDIFNVMRDIVQNVCGIDTVVLADQSALSPPGKYASIRATSSALEGAHGRIKQEYDEDSQRVKTTIDTPIQWDVTINFWRCKDPVAIASRLVDCSRLPSVHLRLFRAGLGWLGTDPVQNLTAEQSGMYEHRSAIVAHLVGNQSVTDECNSIEKLNGFSVYDDEEKIFSKE